MSSEQMAGLYFVGAVVVVAAMALWLIELAWKAWRRRQDARADVRWPGRWVEINAPPVILERAYAQHDMNPREGLERPGAVEVKPELKRALVEQQQGARPLLTKEEVDRLWRSPFARPARFGGDALAGLGECDCDGCRNLRLLKAGA